MYLRVLLCFGIVGTVCAVYEIPECDACVIRVLSCDNFTKPLSPIKNSALEMFRTIEQLNAVCDGLSEFRTCLKVAEEFCEEHSKVPVGFDLLNNRRLAFDLCERDSALQQEYFMVNRCVNRYSNSTIEFCIDRTVETLGLDFYLGDIDMECRYLGFTQYCHMSIITDKCGSIAGNMLEKLAAFRGGRDLVCIEYEKERLKNLTDVSVAVDSYIQKYKNRVAQNGMEDRFYNAKYFNTPQETSSKFHSWLSLVPDNDSASDNNYASDCEHRFNLGTIYRTEKQLPCSCLSENKMLYSEYISRKIAKHTRHFYEQPTSTALSDENCACKTKASFLLMGIRANGQLYHLGYGAADVLWDISSPLGDVSCAWIVNPSAPMPLVKCLILIDPSLVTQKYFKGKMECDLPSDATIAVYETVNEIEAERVAELRVQCFVKYSPTLQEKFNNMIKFFKYHAHNIRFWCTKQIEGNSYIEPNRAQSTSRIGFIPYGLHENDMVDIENRISDHKYNFYKPEEEEYPIDTEIHLISSGEESLKNKFEAGDDYATQNYEKTMNPFLLDEMPSGENYDRTSTPRPPTSKKSSHSYRPFELFRPRMGDALEAEYRDVLNEDLTTNDAEDGNLESNVLPFEDANDNGHTSRLYSGEMCPVLPENISKLVHRPGSYSKLNYVNPQDIVESNDYEKFSFSEKVIPLRHIICKVEEPEHVVADKLNQFEETYVVTPSTEIETSSIPTLAVSENAVEQNIEDYQVFNNEDGYENLAEVPQESSFKDLTLENDKFRKIIHASTNHEIASEKERSSPYSKIFSKKRGQKYTNEMEELSDAFEVLAKIQLNVRRLRSILREAGIEENEIIQRKIEL